MQYQQNYPDSIDEVLDPPVRFRRQTVTAVTQFARMRPWRGTLEQRMEKFRMLHVELCAVYGKTTVVTFRTMDGGCSGSSHYDPRGGEMVLTGRLSVVTFLHEFAHALGRDERGACRWSLNLFRRCFPRSFARCRAEVPRLNQ